MFKWIKDKFNKKNIEENIDNIKEEVIDLKEDLAEEVNSTKEILSEKVENIQENLKDTKEDLKSNFEDSKEAVESKTQELKEVLKDKYLNEKEKIEENKEKIKDNIVEKKQELTKEFEEIKEDVKDNIKSIKDDISEEVDNAKEILEEKSEKVSFFKKLKDGLSKTRKEMGVKINTILGAYVKIDDELLEDLEDILISADIGMQTTMKLIDNLRQTIIENKINDPNMVKPLLKEEVKKLMNPFLNNKIITTPPTVILIVGVNGVGKTTTIGKLSAKLKSEGKKVMVAAADTFRAAAIDQLKTWGERANVEVIHHSEGADPAAVVFDGIAAAKARGADILICDTAGRLHNKVNLMNELEKINRIIDREYAHANRETLLVLDATTGQNAMNQAKTFKEATGVTGIVLTKLDGTAKGGVVIALQSELETPIKLIGVGEGIDDLQEFNVDSFIDAIFD